MALIVVKPQSLVLKTLLSEGLRTARVGGVSVKFYLKLEAKQSCCQSRIIVWMQGQAMGGVAGFLGW